MKSSIRPKRRLGPFEVSPIGLGCMNTHHVYGPPLADAEVQSLIDEAVDLGVDHFDTAALYGFGSNEAAVGKALHRHRSRIVLASKGGMVGEAGADGIQRRVIDGRPQALQRHCEDSLRRLGTNVIDLYYLHRWDKTRVPIEESVGGLARLVEQGKVRAIGLSEVSAATLRRAHAVHPIAALQSEYSAAARNAERGALAVCAELGVAYVSFGTLMRGFLAGADCDRARLPAGDIRHSLPRFEPANLALNQPALAAWKGVAQEAGCTPAQLAIVWLLARGAHLHSIPGTRRIEHLRDNVAATRLVIEPALLARADAAIGDAQLAGARYNAQGLAEVDTEPV
jgi:aryl-alcohol dehydrogenase-like predicted oxidoreductase